MSYLTAYIEDYTIADELIKDIDFFSDVFSAIGYEIDQKTENNKTYFYGKLAKTIKDSDYPEEVLNFIKELLKNLEEPNE